MAGSALAVDQDAYEMARRARSSEHEREVLIRRYRNAALGESRQIISKPKSFPRGDALYVGVNAVCDHVDPHTVTVAMSLQLKHSKETLQLAEKERRVLVKILACEIREISDQFPKALSAVPSRIQSPSDRTSRDNLGNIATSRNVGEMISSSSNLPPNRSGQITFGHDSMSLSSTAPARLMNDVHETSVERDARAPEAGRPEMISVSRPVSRIRPSTHHNMRRCMSSRFDSPSVPLNLVRPQLPPLPIHVDKSQYM